MIDRAARDQVISAFEAYLDDQITAFEFDDRLQQIESEDRTVNKVIHAAWFHSQIPEAQVSIRDRRPEDPI